MSTLSVDASDPTPPYEQIRSQLALLMDSGELSVGQRLPTVRQLASDLQVAPGTVQRAFKELEAAGYVETRRAAGTRVLEREHPVERAELRTLATGFVDAARRAGAADAEVIDAVRTALARDRFAPDDLLPRARGGAA